MDSAVAPAGGAAETGFGDSERESGWREEIAASWRWMEARCESRDEEGVGAELATGTPTTGEAAVEARVC